jgi:hypothetical protein
LRKFTLYFLTTAHMRYSKIRFGGSKIQNIKIPLMFGGYHYRK